MHRHLRGQALHMPVVRQRNDLDMIAQAEQGVQRRFGPRIIERL